MPSNVSQWASAIALEAVVGLAIGSLIGIFARIARQRADSNAGFHLGGVLIDALLGAVGFTGGAIGMTFLPWRHTVVTSDIGGMIVSTTTMRYRYPYQIAFLLAIALPALYELIRRRKKI